MAGLVPAIHVLFSSIMASGYVYILSNKPNGVLYVGVTNDLIRRVYQHKNKLTKGFTAQYRVDRLVWFETHDDITSAIEREKELKKWRREWNTRPAHRWIDPVSPARQSGDL